jgi:glycosyltransferase involved in cell wall biosynthesis
MSSHILPKLCLNMIVKNESKIIRRLFDSVINVIDSYCICDTGSTDDTPAIIEAYFKEKGKPGKVILEPFRDFGYNRSYSLLACSGMANADYILLMDADMILETGPKYNWAEFKQGLLCADAHYVFQGSQTMSYKNVRIVKNGLGIKYWGVTHEVIDTPPNSVYSAIEKSMLFINDVGDGGAKADKYERDIRLLLRGLEDKPNNDRYTFYLANSYRENGQREKAIEMYKKRIEIGGWIEEIWQSYYNIGKCYMILGEHEKAIANWLEGYDRFPQRLENIYEIMTYYRGQSKHRLVYEFYMIAKKRLIETRGKTLDHLFVQNDVYDYKIDYEYTISGYYHNPNKIDIAFLSMQVMAVPSIEGTLLKNTLSNYKFYAPKLMMWQDIIRPPLSPNADFVNSTPSMCYLDNGRLTVVNTRFVNYRIGEKGEYINKEKIVTRNLICVYNNKTKVIEREFELEHNRELDGTYVGLEDVRLIEHGNEVYFTANRGLSGGTMFVEYGKINLESGKTESNILIKTDGRTNIEKNWTLFLPSKRTDGPKDLKCSNRTDGPKDLSKSAELKIVYKWHPFTTYEIAQNSSLTSKDVHESPRFFEHLRGSTNGISVGSETWFICHAVSYDERRHYYHILVAIDAESGEVKRWTRFFTFDGQPVEYILGFVYDEMTSEFLLGYSTMDRTTEFKKVSKGIFESMFV